MMEKKTGDVGEKTNIYKFPIHKRLQDGILIPPEFRERQNKEYLNVVVDEIMQAIINSLNMSGVNCNTESFSKDISVVAMLLEAALYRTEGIETPLTDIIAAIIDELSADDEDEDSQDNKPE